MVEVKTTTAIDIATSSAVIKLGSFQGSSIGAQLTGAATTSGDSDWKLVQSNDETNWVDIASGTFTDIGNETLSFSGTDVHHMLYLGLQRSSVGTETTGTVTLRITVK